MKESNVDLEGWLFDDALLIYSLPYNSTARTLAWFVLKALGGRKDSNIKKLFNIVRSYELHITSNNVFLRLIFASSDEITHVRTNIPDIDLKIPYNTKVTIVSTGGW